MPEEWRPVRGYEGAYEASNLGKVRSVERFVGGREGSRRKVRGKLITARERPDGTLAVNIWAKNRYRQVPIRRVVLEAFDRAQPIGFDAVNVNGDPTDNRLTNLAWQRDKQLLAGLRRILGR